MRQVRRGALGRVCRSPRSGAELALDRGHPRLRGRALVGYVTWLPLAPCSRAGTPEEELSDEVGSRVRARRVLPKLVTETTWCRSLFSLELTPFIIMEFCFLYGIFWFGIPGQECCYLGPFPTAPRNRLDFKGRRDYWRPPPVARGWSRESPGPLEPEQEPLP